MNHGPYVTVFIPTYFGEERLDDLLGKVFKQKVDFLFEVLIYDTSSTDRTPEIINKYASKHSNVRHKTIAKSKFSHGKTRRDAAQDAKGEIVVYLSQDAIPAHNRWLYEMVKPFELNPKIAGVLGKQDPQPNAFPLLKYEIRSVFNSFGSDNGTTLFYKDSFIKEQSQYDLVSFYSDVNSAGRRSILTGEVPYQPVSYAEDQLFGRDIINHGYIKAYAPRGNVLHSNDIRLRDYKARMFDETVGLRGVGIPIDIPTYRTIIKTTLKGVTKDSTRIVFDKDYSWKRKLYWLVVNPFYHIEKWKGVRLGAAIHLDNIEKNETYSLEKQQAKRQAR